MPLSSSWRLGFTMAAHAGRVSPADTAALDARIAELEAEAKAAKKEAADATAAKEAAEATAKEAKQEAEDAKAEAARVAEGTVLETSDEPAAIVFYVAEEETHTKGRITGASYQLMKLTVTPAPDGDLDHVGQAERFENEDDAYASLRRR